MHIEQIDSLLRELLGPGCNLPGEYGFTSTACQQVTKIGYATNLTPHTVQGAIEHKVDLLLTHHDAWGFVYGMSDACHEALEINGISHLYAHLPLDSAPFGTAVSLISSIGAEIAGDIALEKGFACGRTARFRQPVALATVAEALKATCKEDPQVWSLGADQIERIGVVTGAGSMTNYAKEAHDQGCQLYITGERSLYLVQYCLLVGMNLAVCSHTFTELPGVKALAAKVSDLVPGIQVIEIPESHDELMPNKAVRWPPLRDATDL